jgi:thiol:disulfide interchange protein
VLSILLPILLIVQSLLPAAGRWVSALHPVNAFVILGMVGYLSWTFWRGAAMAEEVATARAL